MFIMGDVFRDINTDLKKNQITNYRILYQAEL